MAYADKTLRDANPVKRYLQDARFEDAIALIDASLRDCRILDFGGGDGELCLRLAARFAGASLVCYEPAPGMYREAEARLAGLDRIRLTDTLDGIARGSCDVVLSLEVFEHLPVKEMEDALHAIHALLSDDGVLIIGIPNELYFAALYKGLFRMTRRYGAFDARPRHILAAATGRPPSERPARKVSQDKHYHFEHMGFDYRRLREKLVQRFELVAQVCSPFRWLPQVCSPEIYFVLRRRRDDRETYK